MPRQKISLEDRASLLSEYISGASPAELGKKYLYKRTTIKELMRRSGCARTQSEASSLAVSKGKKDKAIRALIKATKSRRKYQTYYQRNRTRCLQKMNDRSLKKRYGITKADKDRMFADQLGCCAICGRYGIRLVVDHCHKTNRIRGLLCDRCNAYLGIIKDSFIILQKAIDYLEGGQ